MTKAVRRTKRASRALRVLAVALIVVAWVLILLTMLGVLGVDSGFVMTAILWVAGASAGGLSEKLRQRVRDQTSRPLVWRCPEDRSQIWVALDSARPRRLTFQEVRELEETIYGLTLDIGRDVARREQQEWERHTAQKIAEDRKRGVGQRAEDQVPVWWENGKAEEIPNPNPQHTAGRFLAPHPDEVELDANPDYSAKTIGSHEEFRNEYGSGSS